LGKTLIIFEVLRGQEECGSRGKRETPLVLAGIDYLFTSLPACCLNIIQREMTPFLYYK